MASGYRATVVSNDLGRRRDAIEQRTGAVVLQAGLWVIAHAAPLTPVDTGLLVSSPAVHRGATDQEADVIWSPDYAAIQEDRVGFAEQAVERVEPLFRAAIAEAVDP